MNEQEITTELMRMAEQYKAEEDRRRVRMVAQPQAAGNAQAIPETPQSGPDLNEYAYVGAPTPPVTGYEAQFRPKLSTEQGQGPYPPLRMPGTQDARAGPQVPAGYTYGDDQVTRDPNGIPAVAQYPSPSQTAWDTLTAATPSIGSALAVGIPKAVGTGAKYAETVRDLAKEYGGTIGKYLGEVGRGEPDRNVPELQNSHGGSAVSGVIEGLRDFYKHPGNVYQGKADPKDPKQAFNFATTMMTGGLGGVPRQAGEVALGSGPIRAYHGSPHDFDKFDLSKIGTGEGAQAYGHGLYFAEKEGTAQTYRDALAGKAPMRVVSRTPEGLPHFEKRGRMYEVNIHADPERFLDWDKPLGGQPAADVFRDMGKNFDPSTTGGSAYEASVGPGRWHPEAANTRMTEAGIPGIKYLDQGSRTAGEGSRNYVVFSPDVIEIMRKYGVASFAALPPAVQMAIQGMQKDAPPKQARERTDF